ncbi:MAG: hypothetical protein ACYTHJ_12940 [Planctomycetota bacterium]|jgi:hypothetical protein
MIRSNLIMRCLAFAALFAAGCGAIPDFMVEAARASAKASLEEAVAGAVDGVIDNTIGAALDIDDFELPADLLDEGAEEDGESQDENENVDDEGLDPGRGGRSIQNRRF